MTDRGVRAIQRMAIEFVLVIAGREREGCGGTLRNSVLASLPLSEVAGERCLYCFFVDSTVLLSADASACSPPRMQRPLEYLARLTAGAGKSGQPLAGTKQLAFGL